MVKGSNSNDVIHPSASLPFRSASPRLRPGRSDDGAPHQPEHSRGIDHRRSHPSSIDPIVVPHMDSLASMSMRLRAPVLTVDAAEMRKIDPRNVNTLFGMWSVFSKCAEAMEDGRRYENLSWRLWNRETFCCRSPDPSPTTATATATATTSPPASVPIRRTSSGARRAAADDVPELSASVESATSDHGHEHEPDDDAVAPTAAAPGTAARCTPLAIEHPLICRVDSLENRCRSRGREKHITSFHLERIFTTIKATKALEARVPSSLALGSHDSRRSELTVDVTPPLTARLVPAAVPAPAVRAVDAADAVVTAPRPCGPVLAGESGAAGLTKEEMKRKNNVFLLGGSSGEEESSLEEHMPLSQTLAEAVAPGTRPAPATGTRKQTSFQEEVCTRTLVRPATPEPDATTTDDEAAEGAVDEEDDGDVVSESAIDDDDSSDWDSVTESGRSSVDDKPLFQRVDSKPTLTSRRSLLTNLLHQGQREAAFAEAAAAAGAGPGTVARSSAAQGIARLAAYRRGRGRAYSLWAQYNCAGGTFHHSIS
ncbi:MAG: hypothetical protein M1826_004481 [Phylliscum demangeonii]|nr:MAG: hypothetical protein M1826_004481 [Phylliscum demangeonii]